MIEKRKRADRLPSRRRADALLVLRGLADSESEARALILAGKVWCGETRVEKAGQVLAVDCGLRVRQPAIPFVSRGGVKLAGALDEFQVSVRDRVCLDVGASTGGFTDCLLQRGARRVLALDVGRGQLDWKLVQDPRVVRLEGINARYLRPEDLPEPPEVVTVDVSFISLSMLLPGVLQAVGRGEGGSVILLALVKPQFEAAREQVEKGGIVRDPEVQQGAVERVRDTIRQAGWRLRGFSASALTGASGNQEYFIHAQGGGDR